MMMRYSSIYGWFVMQAQLCKGDLGLVRAFERNICFMQGELIVGSTSFNTTVGTAEQRPFILIDIWILADFQAYLTCMSKSKTSSSCKSKYVIYSFSCVIVIKCRFLSFVALPHVHMVDISFTAGLTSQMATLSLLKMLLLTMVHFHLRHLSL